MGKLEKEIERQRRDNHMLSFVGSDKLGIDNNIFQLWNYLYPQIKNPGTLTLFENAYQIQDKNHKLTPTNTEIRMSLYKDIYTGENQFYIMIQIIDYKNEGVHFCKDFTVKADEHLIKTYNYSKYLRKKFPNAWKKGVKVKDEVIKEKSKMILPEDWESTYKERIKKLCAYYKIDVHFAAGSIILSTPFCSWRVYEHEVINGDELVLYHKNKHSDVNDWHKQKYRTSDIRKLVRYIHKHDYEKNKIDATSLK